MEGIGAMGTGAVFGIYFFYHDISITMCNSYCKPLTILHAYTHIFTMLEDERIWAKDRRNIYTFKKTQNRK
jgi:hypothetical protein